MRGKVAWVTISLLCLLVIVACPTLPSRTDAVPPPPSGGTRYYDVEGHIGHTSVWFDITPENGVAQVDGYRVTFYDKDNNVVGERKEGGILKDPPEGELNGEGTLTVTIPMTDVPSSATSATVTVGWNSPDGYKQQTDLFKAKR